MDGDRLVWASSVHFTMMSRTTICLGCRIFGLLIRAGVIPNDVCVRCDNLWAGSPGAVAGRLAGT
jgi:hypothetical protein